MGPRKRRTSRAKYFEMGNSPKMVMQNYNDPKSKADGADYFALRPSSFENVVPLPLEFGPSAKMVTKW